MTFELGGEGVTIANLLAEDAAYAYHAWYEPIRGRDAIVADWLSERDEPESWKAEYRPFIVADNRSVAVGQTRHADGRSTSISGS